MDASDIDAVAVPTANDLRVPITVDSLSSGARFSRSCGALKLSWIAMLKDEKNFKWGISTAIDASK
jgi:hypothetical protein